MTRKLQHRFSPPALAAAVVIGLAGALDVSAAPLTPATVDVASSGTPHDAWFAVAFEGNTGLAAGSAGRLLETSDAGGAWSVVQTDTQNALLGVSVKGDHGIAVGQLGVILRRGADGGWAEVESTTDERLMAVSVNRAGQAAVVGSFGTILMSADGGETWREAPPQWDSLSGGGEMLGGGYGPNLYAVDIDEQGVVTIAGEWGMVLRTEDAGENWSVLHIGDTVERIRDATLFGMYVDGPRIVGVGQEGAVLISLDGGETWNESETGSSANLLSVAVAGNGRIVVTGMRAMLTTKDGGDSWTEIDGADIAIGWYSGAAAPTNGDELSDVIFAVGHAGRVLRIGGVSGG